MRARRPRGLGDNGPAASSSVTAWPNVLREAGIEDADAVVVATNGDNTNIVVGQVAQKRFGIECTVVRILDPARAELYATLGLRTVCPTSNAIEVPSEAVKSCTVRPVKAPAVASQMFVLVAGMQVLARTSRALRRMDHEVTIIEQDRVRFVHLEEALRARWRIRKCD